MTSAFSFSFEGDDIEPGDDLDIDFVLEGRRGTARESNLLPARGHDVKDLVSHDHKQCFSGVLVFQSSRVALYLCLLSPFSLSTTCVSK